MEPAPAGTVRLASSRSSVSSNKVLLDLLQDAEREHTTSLSSHHSTSPTTGHFRNLPPQTSGKMLRVEVNGLLHDWFDVSEMGDFIRSTAFADTLRENVARYFNVPLERQAIYDEDGLLTTCADLSRALQRGNPKLYVYDLDEMSDDLRRRAVEELKQLDSEFELSWRRFEALGHLPSRRPHCFLQDDAQQERRRGIESSVIPAKDDFHGSRVVTANSNAHTVVEPRLATYTPFTPSRNMTIAKQELFLDAGLSYAHDHTELQGPASVWTTSSPREVCRPVAVPQAPGAQLLLTPTSSRRELACMPSCSEHPSTPTGMGASKTIMSTPVVVRASPLASPRFQSTMPLPWTAVVLSPRIIQAPASRDSMTSAREASIPTVPSISECVGPPIAPYAAAQARLQTPTGIVRGDAYSMTYSPSPRQWTRHSTTPPGHAALPSVPPISLPPSLTFQFMPLMPSLSLGQMQSTFPSTTSCPFVQHCPHGPEIRE